MSRYIIFGAGGVGKKCKKLLEGRGHEIIGFADNDSDKWGSLFEEVRVYSPADITSLPYEEVAIGVYKAASSIREQLVGYGVPEANISVPIEPNKVFYNDRIDYDSHLPDEEGLSNCTRTFLKKRVELNDGDFYDKLEDLKRVLEENNIPFQNVCVCSGAVLQAYGLRKSKKFDDIDVIMTSDYRELYGKGLVIISETAEMHKQDEYDIPDDEIIGNPDNHFWFQGLKFMNIEFLL